MNEKQRFLLNWVVGVLLVLVMFYAAVSWLWKASEESAAESLKSQVLSILSGDLAEGNLFKLGATLTKLRQEGFLRFAEIRQVQGALSNSIYRTSGTDEGLQLAFSNFTCRGGYKLVRVTGGGVGIITILPSLLPGAECTAVYMSSDLPTGLKKLKTKIIISFGVLIVLVMGFILLLTISWHKKVVILEVVAKTAVAERDAAIGRMAAQVAHDIRSPLAALGAAAKGLELPAEQRALIDGSVKRMQGIADDLLHRYRAPGAGTLSKDAADPQAQAEVKKTEICALTGLVEQIVSEKRLQHEDKPGVKIEFNNTSKEIKASVDPKEFQRLLSNLINNSVEAFPGPGIVTVTLSENDGRVLIEVKDNGKGIPSEVLAKLGHKGETHGKTGGTGLGLYHARTSVESWGGSLKIVSEPGKGTAVTITLPAIKADKNRNAVLLDDDMLVHMNWKMSAKAAGVEFKAYKDPKEFAEAVADLPKDTAIYIDSDLGDNVKGEDIAKDLHEKGFTAITMATGHAADKFAHLSWLKTVGKEPPWA